MYISLFWANSRQNHVWRLFLVKTLFCFSVTLTARAHPSPNSLIFVDVRPDKVLLEVQMPVPELELAFGHGISQNPEKIIVNWESQLKEYLLQHIHAYVSKDRPWQVNVTKLVMDKGLYADNINYYWEVNATVELIPYPEETTRSFYLDYDVIMHQVINHAAFVSVRSDWEAGNLHGNATEAQVQAIGWDNQNNVIPPIAISLEKGSWWKGFKSMMLIGMKHIKEGTDHLLFLIVLLLPAMLLTNGKRWGSFGGIKYSLVRLLKIVTAFTIGHSITLLISTVGLLTLPSQPIELLIAFSILVSAVHAAYPLFPGKETYIAAGFGLVHGLAFATVLTELKLSAWTLVWSLLGFNVGIELMQLMIICAVIPWLILLSKTPFYKWFRLTGAALSGIAAVGWLVARSTNKENSITDTVTRLAEHAHLYVVILAVMSIAAFIGYTYNRRKQQAMT